MKTDSQMFAMLKAEAKDVNNTSCALVDSMDTVDASDADKAELPSSLMTCFVDDSLGHL